MRVRKFVPAKRFRPVQPEFIQRSFQSSIGQDFPFANSGIAVPIIVNKETIVVSVIALLIVIGDYLLIGIELNSFPVGI